MCSGSDLGSRPRPGVGIRGNGASAQTWYFTFDILVRATCSLECVRKKGKGNTDICEGLLRLRWSTSAYISLSNRRTPYSPLGKTKNYSDGKSCTLTHLR